MKKSLALILSLLLAITAFTTLAPAYAQSPVTITIAPVYNGDMVVMQSFSAKFEAAYPNIKLNWVMLPENCVSRCKDPQDIVMKAMADAGAGAATMAATSK